eukprot:s1019_g20.t1
MRQATCSGKKWLKHLCDHHTAPLTHSARPGTVGASLVYRQLKAARQSCTWAFGAKDLLTCELLAVQAMRTIARLLSSCF